jgi:hypothetical protein
MIEKAERFAPGAGRKHRQQADAEYAAALSAADLDQEGGVEPGPDPSGGRADGGGTDPGAGGS